MSKCTWGKNKTKPFQEVFPVVLKSSIKKRKKEKSFYLNYVADKCIKQTSKNVLHADLGPFGCSELSACAHGTPATPGTNTNLAPTSSPGVCYCLHNSSLLKAQPSDGEMHRQSSTDIMAFFLLAGSIKRTAC